jgi:hypothetical protein
LGIGDWGLGIGANPQSPVLEIIILIINFNNLKILDNLYQKLQKLK